MIKDSFLLPIAAAALLALCLLVAAFFASLPSVRHRYRIRRARRVLDKLQGFRDAAVIPYLRKVDPYVFEEIVLEAFDRKGFKVWRNRRYSGDGGFDGKVKVGGEIYLIQDKRYSNYVNHRHVAAFDELCRRKGCKGYFIHTGKTGEASKGVARHSPRVAIICGKELIDLIKS